MVHSWEDGCSKEAEGPGAVLCFRGHRGTVVCDAALPLDLWIEKAKLMGQVSYTGQDACVGNGAAQSGLDRPLSINN